MNPLVKALLGSVFLSLFVFDASAKEFSNGELVNASYQDRVYFSALGSNVKVALISRSDTTLIFRVYDNTLMDVSLKKGHFDGKPETHPRVINAATVGNSYRENTTLTFVSPDSLAEVHDGMKLLPIYQSASGHRIYYVMNSYRDTGSDARRFKFYVQKPVK